VDSRARAAIAATNALYRSQRHRDVEANVAIRF
jgi:hypothetical protein